MATCSSTVFPPAVIKAVEEQMKTHDVDPKEIPEALVLKPSMTKSNLKDVVVSWESYLHMSSR